ncbi:MAG: hypothetical protein QM758_12910 [Armatimonas sp.]
MNASRRFGVSGDFGLAILTAWPSLVVGLSFTRTSPASIAAVALLGLPLALLGAITWLRAGQEHPKVFFQKRLFAGICAALTAGGLVSVTLHSQLQKPEPVVWEDDRCVFERLPDGGYVCRRHCHLW